MSQPFLIVALTNIGDTTCHLAGYPSLRATGHLVGGPGCTLTINVQPGALYEVKDPGRHRVQLSPGGSAAFAVGTATAYGVSLYDIPSLAITPPGGHTALRLAVDLLASAPKGAPIPLTVTALTAGTKLPPQL